MFSNRKLYVLLNRKLLVQTVNLLHGLMDRFNIFSHLYNFSTIIFFNFVFQKESVIFALYSSHWTEMDLKCKKLILLTMKMNNAHKQKLKFTQMRIVNLDLFFRVRMLIKLII